MKNAYPVKSTKQVFRIENQVIMWWTFARIQRKFVLRHQGPFEIVAILRNGIYKLVDERETLKTSINRNLLKLYKSYEFIELIVVID